MSSPSGSEEGSTTIDTHTSHVDPTTNKIQTTESPTVRTSEGTGYCEGERHENGNGNPSGNGMTKEGDEGHEGNEEDEEDEDDEDDEEDDDEAEDADEDNEHGHPRKEETIELAAQAGLSAEVLRDVAKSVGVNLDLDGSDPAAPLSPPLAHARLHVHHNHSHNHAQVHIPGSPSEESAENGDGHDHAAVSASPPPARPQQHHEHPPKHEHSVSEPQLDLNGHDGQAEGGDVEDGGDEDGEEDDDDESEDEDAEPVLKYELLGNGSQNLLKKDSASALAVSGRKIALGTHNGRVYILTTTGERLHSFRPHSASVLDICLDATGDFVATASMDGRIVIHALSTPESYAFDMKRPMRTIALDPQFARRSSRAFVCGGQAGTLVLHEKGWLGHKQTTLHSPPSTGAGSADGPVYVARWRGSLIAWANDAGVRVHDVTSYHLIAHVDRPGGRDAPRADLFRCTLQWQDDATLLIGWADYIQVARVRTRAANAVSPTSGGGGLPPVFVEITSVFRLDCMISGVLPHPTNPTSGPWPAPSSQHALTMTSFLVLAWVPPEESTFDDEEEATTDRRKQMRREAEAPELRIISRMGEELSSDVLNVAGFKGFGCSDYVLAEISGGGAVGDAGGVGGADAGEGQQEEGGRMYVVATPRNIVLVRPRDRRDHVAWLVERQRYEEALEEVESMGLQDGVSVPHIGQEYIKHLIEEGSFDKAARLCPKVCAQDVEKWEQWIFVFAQKHHLPDIIPFVPTSSPQLGHTVYEMILGHYLGHDRKALLRTIKDWPPGLYNIASVIVAVQDDLDKEPASCPDSVTLMECQAELYTLNRQPGKALPFFLRLRRPTVFDLIRENNLFTDVQNQALLLVEFDQELMQKRRDAQKAEGKVVVDDQDQECGTAINLLVDHTHSIPVERVVEQLKPRPRFLYLYLEALFKKDPSLTAPFADDQVKLYAEYSPLRLVAFLRANNDYNLEKAYGICKEKDLVPEMVFLLGRMGNNKAALSLIIERLGDVQRAIEFAREQRDEDLWEDLLRYSESRPTFIKGLLENVGADINPIRLIRRIKDGLEIPGLKASLIKILHDANLQISLMEGCETIMHGDCSELAKKLHMDQTRGFFASPATVCQVCNLPLHQGPQSLTLTFLCRHIVHAGCAGGLNVDDLPRQPDPALVGMGIVSSRGISGKLAFAQLVREQLSGGCPVCASKSEGNRT